MKSKLSLSLDDQPERILHDGERCVHSPPVNQLQVSSCCVHPNAMSWDGGEIVPNITTRSNWQLMPDKGNFGCILVKKN